MSLREKQAAAKQTFVFLKERICEFDKKAN